MDQINIEKRISIGRVKEVLGSKATNLSDKEIEIILRTFYALCNRIVNNVIQNNL